MPPTWWRSPRNGPDVVGLREEAAAIRRNLEEMAADRALGLITRPQLLAATGRANVRLEEIGTELEHAARENVLAPLVAAENAAAVWADLDLSRKRAVIKTLMAVTLHSPGRGARARRSTRPRSRSPGGSRTPPDPGQDARVPDADGRGVLAATAARAAQEEREGVTLLAGQGRGGIDQPGDVGIQAGLMVVFGKPVAVVALVVLAVRGRGRA